jgi:hypothetical protein
MPLLLYLSISGWCLNIFCIVFVVRNAIFICVSRKSLVVFLTSFPLYVNVAHFVFCCCVSLCVVLFLGSLLLHSLMLYRLLSSMFLMVFNSIYFPSFVIG